MHVQAWNYVLAASCGDLVPGASHVTEQFDKPGLREQVVREIGEIYKGNIFFGEDLQEIPMQGPQVARLD